MAPARPMLDEIELQQVQSIDVEADQVLIQHAVPALEGDFLQRLDRRASRISLRGILTGDEVRDGLEKLRAKFRAAAPVPFIADLTTATKVEQVLIEELGVRELAGKPARFEYAFTLREFLPPPAPAVEPPPPEPPAEPDPETGTLIVEVIVENQPRFDFTTVTVTAAGTQADGTALSRTLPTQEQNVWTEEQFPPGQYTASAVVTEPQSMSGSAAATVRAGQTTRVTITLRAGRIIAKAFVVHFRFDSAFVEPCMRHVLHQVSEYAQAHADEKLLIVGHTDRTGSDEYNQSLSERRARSVFAYLTFGRDRATSLREWNDLRRSRPVGTTISLNDTWGAREYQYMLQDLGFYPGNVNGDATSSDAAVRGFQEDRGLTVDGIVGDQTWAALIEAYLSQQPLAVPENQFLPNAGDGCNSGILKWLGCGEENPLPQPQPTTQDPHRPYRRVELLFVRATRLPCAVPQPDTFNVPTPGAVGAAWCLGPGNPQRHCCFATRDCAQARPDQWCIVPAEPATITVRGSMKFEDGTPAAKVHYVLIAPDGEFMDGEATSGSRRGNGILGSTGTDGAFAYPTAKGVGTYTLEIEDPWIARLDGEPLTAAKGNIVCKRLDGSSDFDVIVAPAESGDQRLRLLGTIHDQLGRIRQQTEVQVLFSDGNRATTRTNDTGEFVIDLDRQHESAKIFYTLGEAGASEPVFFTDFFIDVQPITTDEGIRRRLHNLGYLIGDDLPGALMSFQSVQGLNPTGEIDEPTRAKLVAVHDGAEPIVPEFTQSQEPLRSDELIGEGPPP